MVTHKSTHKLTLNNSGLTLTGKVVNSNLLGTIFSGVSHKGVTYRVILSNLNVKDYTLQELINVPK